MLLFYAITCVAQGLGLAVPPTHGVVAVVTVFGVVVIDAVVVAIVTFKGRESFRVYAHLLAKKRRAEGCWDRVWEVSINGGGGGEGRPAAYPLPGVYLISYSRDETFFRGPLSSYRTLREP